MSRSIVRAWILVAWGLVAGVVLFAIQGHERTLRHGELVLLRLAPVDPRSLMQGDYMALRLAVDAELASVSGETESPKQSRPSLAYFTLDESRRAEFAGTGESPRHAAGQISMRIRILEGRATVGPNAFFFQEGTGELFETAQWGGFRVAADGTALLVSLHDEQLQRIGEQKR
jgi:uncharacterized membrane-anchored protein